MNGRIETIKARLAELEQEKLCLLQELESLRIDQTNGWAARCICGRLLVVNRNFCFQYSDRYAMDEVLPCLPSSGEFAFLFCSASFGAAIANMFSNSIEALR